MKVKGSANPDAVVVEYTGGALATVWLRENIEVVDELEQGQVYQYDEYRCQATYSDGLYEKVCNQFSTWVAFARDKEITQAECASREYRNFLLTESDWMVVSDADISEQSLQDAKAYRQALRDITKDPMWPHILIWPARPTVRKTNETEKLEV